MLDRSDVGPEMDRGMNTGWARVVLRDHRPVSVTNEFGNHICDRCAQCGRDWPCHNRQAASAHQGGNGGWLHRVRLWRDRQLARLTRRRSA